MARVALIAHAQLTSSLAVRGARPSDAPLLHAWRAEPSVGRYQPLGAASVAQLRAELERQDLRDLRRGTGVKFQWLIEVGGAPAGWLTLVVTNWDHGLGELGYALSTPHQGRGHMAPALAQLIAEVFESTRLERLEARCAVDNRPSQRVLERCGFRREGVLRGYFRLGGRRVDNYLYALLRDDPRPGPSALASPSTQST
jgi:ribosomal-protein-alanine N-acetyltransferase